METKNNLDTFRILYIVRASLLIFGTLTFSIYWGILSFIFQLPNNTSSHDTDTAGEFHFNHNSDMPFDTFDIVNLVKGIGLFFILILIVFIVLNFLTAKYIREQKNYNFIFAIGILNCLTGILGILLGIFTLIEITKPEVKTLFFKNTDIDS